MAIELIKINFFYLHWGLGIRIVRILRPPFSDSLSEQILSELFDPRGLDIRTHRNSDSLIRTTYILHLMLLTLLCHFYALQL